MSDSLHGLIGEFRPLKPGNPIFCHQDFLDKIEANRNNGVGKRAALLLHRLLVDERRQHFKSTHGANRGWRRSRLGGSSGSHFYAWWAPKGAPPLQDLPEFQNAPDGALFLRDIRHHDDHSALNPQSLAAQYLPLSARDLKEPDFVPAPWTPQQTRFATARAAVRLLKGHPGSGKTTALWTAAENAARRNALYITYSRDLAALARDHFDKLAPASINFRVLPFPQLLRELLGIELDYTAVPAARARFIRETATIPPRVLGPWQDNRGALYDEIYAHVVGEALPAASGRFPASPEPCLPPQHYRQRRTHAIGSPAVEALLQVIDTVRKRDSGNFVQTFFPELWLAGRAGSHSLPQHFCVYDCLAIDEVQDLTPIEAFVLIRLAQACSTRAVTLLAAGDEAQTVRPTDFEWAWLSDMLHHSFGPPAEYKLGHNLRSPQRIADLVNHVWDLYSHLAKQDRPSGAGRAEVDEDANDQVAYCVSTPGSDLDTLLDSLSAREGLGVITLDDVPPAYVPERLRPSIITVAEAKGLDFHSVCVLDPGKHVARIQRQRDFGRLAGDVEPLSKRLAIDQLRVALSRPTERLYLLDVKPSEDVLNATLDFLGNTRDLRRLVPVIPDVILKTLEEETLDIEERIRLCEADARQFLEVKPELSFSRAEQAVLLSETLPVKPPEIVHPLRRSAAHTLCQVSFTLAFRRTALAPELGRPDFYYIATQNAYVAGRRALAPAIRAVGKLETCHPDSRPEALIDLATSLSIGAADLDSWFVQELSASARSWIDRIEQMAMDGILGRDLLPALPVLFTIFDVPDAEARLARARRKAMQTLIKNKSFDVALDILRTDSEPPPAQMAECYEGMKDFTLAAEWHLKAGNPKEALRCYRAVPDLERALGMVDAIPDHPAAPSLRWVRDMQALAARRPADFGRVMTPSEKKLLEQTLETALGVTRKKPAAKKVAAKKAAPRKAAAKRPRPPF